MPEAAVAHDGDRALGRRHIEGRRAGRAQAVAHGGGAQVEGRQDREQVAADVAGNMVLAQRFLRQRQRREDRALGAAGTEAGRARRHYRRQPLDMLVEGDGLLDGSGGPRARDLDDLGLGGAGGGCVGGHGRMRLQRFGAVAAQEFAQALAHDLVVYSPAMGSTSCPRAAWRCRPCAAPRAGSARCSRAGLPRAAARRACRGRSR